MSPPPGDPACCCTASARCSPSMREESCRRAGLVVVAGVHNVDGRRPRHRRRPGRGAGGCSRTSSAALACVVPLFTPGHRHAAVADAAHTRRHARRALVDRHRVVAQSTTVAAGTWINAGVVVGGLGVLGSGCWSTVRRELGHHSRARGVRVDRSGGRARRSRPRRSRRDGRRGRDRAAEGSHRPQRGRGRRQRRAGRRPGPCAGRRPSGARRSARWPGTAGSRSDPRGPRLRVLAAAARAARRPAPRRDAGRAPCVAGERCRRRRGRRGAAPRMDAATYARRAGRHRARDRARETHLVSRRDGLLEVAQRRIPAGARVRRDHRGRARAATCASPRAGSRASRSASAT